MEGRDKGISLKVLYKKRWKIRIKYLNVNGVCVCGGGVHIKDPNILYSIPLPLLITRSTEIAV